MNKNKLYIGYNKNLKRCLLRPFGPYNYENLETKEIYGYNDYFEGTLMKYKDIKKIINKFKCENKKIDLDKIYVGDIGIITKILDKSLIFYVGVTDVIEFKFVTIISDALLYQVDCDRYLNLINGDLYVINAIKMNVGDFCINVNNHKLKSFISDFNVPVKTLEKKKILKMYDKKYINGGKYEKSI